MKKVLLIATIGLISLGLIGGKYIGRYLINKFDNGDNPINNGIKYTTSYIAETDTMTLLLDNFKQSRSFFM